MQQLIGVFGLIAILQLVFIPGYLVLRLINISMPAIRAVVVGFALSLLINYVLVAALTLCGCYTAKIVWSILGLECLGLIYATQASNWSPWQAQITAIISFWQKCGHDKGLVTFYNCGLLFASLSIILFFIGLFLHQFGEVFTAWDPVMSYNVWAEQWAAGHFPIDTWHYPQLISANWSLTYLITSPASAGVNLQVFAKAVMPLFPLMLMLCFIDLGLECQDSRYFLGLVITLYLLHRFAESFGQGWVDVPVAFFSFLSISLLLIAGRSKHLYRYILLSAFTCGAAAVTKQAGLYLVLWYPVLCYLLALKPQRLKISHNLWLIALAILVILSLCLPWYIYIHYQISHGLAASEVGFVTKNIYQVMGYGLGLRIFFGSILLGAAFWLCMLISTVYAYQKKEGVSVLVIMCFVYTVIWLCFFCYATRNLCIITPWLGLSAAFACHYFYRHKSLSISIEKTRQAWANLNPKPMHILWGFILLVILVSQIPQCSTNALVQSQISQQQSMGDKTLNTMLLRYNANQGFKGKILTPWDYLGHIPGLSQFYQPYRSPSVEANPYQSAWMLNPSDLPAVLAQYPSRYILSVNFDGLVSQAYLNYFANLAQHGVLTVVMEFPGYTLYEINSAIKLGVSKYKS